MGKQSRSKAARRSTRLERGPGHERRRVDVAAVLDEVDDAQHLVATSLSGVRARGITGPDVLRYLGTLLYCHATGLELAELPGRTTLTGANSLLEWSQVVLMTVASLAQSAGPQHDDALWALDQIGVTIAELGMERVPPPPGDDELVAESKRTLARIATVVDRIWTMDPSR